MRDAIRDLIRPKKKGSATPSSKVREATARLEGELEAATAALQQLRVKHADALLGGSDTEVDEVESEIAAGERTLNRLDATRNALGRRLEEAEEADRATAVAGQKAELLALRDKAQGLQTEGVSWIRSEYEIHAKALAAGLERLREIDEEINSTNARLKDNEFEISTVAGTNDFRGGRGLHPGLPPALYSDVRPQTAESTAESPTYTGLYDPARRSHGGVNLPSADGLGEPIFGPGPFIEKDPPPAGVTHEPVVPVGPSSSGEMSRNFTVRSFTEDGELVSVNGRRLTADGRSGSPR